jgi:NAD(P)-dependent dehydrogenase (short-subunit alcohol dehydrogenase family)
MPPRAIDRSTLLDTLELNTWGPLALTQAAVEEGLGDGGAIVYVSSGTVHKTTPLMMAYAAAKAALNAMTRTIARDLAERGIRVNAVAPGLTKTAGTEDLWGADGGLGAAGNLPLGRLTEARDIADAILFLLSDAARQVTGQILDVDGGNHLMGGGFTPMGERSSRAR